jgi:hypothetical protein
MQKEFLVFGTLAILFTGCSYGIRGATASVTPLRGNNYTIIAKAASATKCVTTVFGGGDPPSVSMIVKELIEQNKGEDAINVEFEYREEAFGVILSSLTYGIVRQPCAKVSADIIKYQ